MKLKMTRKLKIVGLSVAIVALIALVAGTTLAYFSDTETSGANTFSAGTLDLKLSNDGTTFSDGVTGTWGATNMGPGDAAITGSVYVKNAGSMAANHVEISFANVVNNVVTPAEIGVDDIDISTHLYVTVMTYGGADLLAAAKTAFDANLDGKLSLKELNAQKIDNLTPPAPGANKQFTMSVQLDSSTTNGNQGDSVTTTVTFTLNQVAAQ